MEEWTCVRQRPELRVNVGKTKVMKCGVGLQISSCIPESTLVGVCGKGVDANDL